MNKKIPNTAERNADVCRNNNRRVGKLGYPASSIVSSEIVVDSSQNKSNEETEGSNPSPADNNQSSPVFDLSKKFILDACCGGRMFWFNKIHPNVIYIDKRSEAKGFCYQRPSFEVQPDEVMDFRNLKFPDKSFKLVVFDPPHIVRIGNKSWMSQKYGMLGKGWENDLKKGFDECWRVLEDFGMLVFKWSESEISCRRILELFDKQPLIGHPTARSGNTKWFLFMKIPKLAGEAFKDG